MIETRFKDTEIGRIPEDWQLDRLKENFEFKANNTLSRDALSESGIIQDVHYGDVLVKYGSHLDVQKDGVPYISDDRFNASSFISDGDIIIADTAEDETVGKATEVLNVRNNKLVSGLHTMWLHPVNQEKYALGYLGYAFNASIYHNQLLPLMQGTKVTSVSKSAIKDTYIPIPPKSEQTRIATALSKVDALISELGKLIEKKRAIKQGAMQQLLTGKKRLKGFSEPWVEKKLGEICEFLNGYTPSKTVNSFWENGTIPWFRMEDIRTNGRILSDAIQHITEEAVKGILFPANSIIMSTTATIGEHALLIVDSLANQQFTNLIIRKSLTQAVDVMWFYHYCFILGEWCRKNINEGGLAAVNMEDFSKVTIAVPQINEQKSIASVLTSMDDEITALEAKKTKYEQIKQGMMQQLLTGRIRLQECVCV